MKISKFCKEKGITLVALIITIVVLLILAVVAINAVQGDGIISHAKNAQIVYQTAQEQEKLLLDEYGSYLNPWKQNGTTVTRENTTLEIGDYVNYDAGTEHTFVTNNEEGCYAFDNESGDFVDGKIEFYTNDLKWRIWGVNEKGQLNLVSSKGISKDSNERYVGYKGENGYLNVENIANKYCNDLYGKGTYALSARCMNLQDITNAINLDINTLSEYGVQWKYRIPSEGANIEISSDDGTTWTAGYYKELKLPGETEKLTVNSEEKTVINTAFEYTLGDSKIENIIKNDENNNPLWYTLATPFANNNGIGQVYFGLMKVGTNGRIDGKTFNLMSNNMRLSSYGAIVPRVIVTLSSDVNIDSKDANGIWNLSK